MTVERSFLTVSATHPMPDLRHILIEARRYVGARSNWLRVVNSDSHRSSELVVSVL
jgi:hypothetical protein